MLIKSVLQLDRARLVSTVRASPDTPTQPMNIKTILTLAAAVLALGLIGNQARADDKVDFETKVLPIFKDRCFECHQKEYTDAKTGKLKKPKGKFRMDNPELLMKGGEEGSNVVAGDAAKSTVYTSVVLPDSDDKAMPPKGDRLTKEQADTIKAWIAGGASFGAWKGAEK
jgi:mono/diheme cytochrome c family protein